MVERALLVGAYGASEEQDDAQDLLNELGELVRTLGIPIAEKLLVHNRAPQAGLFVGSGKADDICAHAKKLDCDIIIFDNQLTPAQQRNWEALSKITVIDRQEVILDIFGTRARTREARIQVDLARMAYSLPRLTRAWSHLGQQGGGIGAKGEGESQLEQDKRKIRTQIDRLKRDLKEVRRNRATQRKDRKRAPVPNVAIVGYTNAGKSSLLRKLTGAEVLVEDALFATLDTTTRKIALPNKQPLLLTDTVGFIRKLPHQLVESFNATLEEAVMADYLIHLLDASHPRVQEFYETTMKVLSTLGADSIQTITVFNKIDLVKNPMTFAFLRNSHPEALFVSVHTGQGLDLLVDRLCDLVGAGNREVLLRLPHERSDLLARIHREGIVHQTEYEDGFIRIRSTIPERLNRLLYSFVIA